VNLLYWQYWETITILLRIYEGFVNKYRILTQDD